MHVDIQEKLHLLESKLIDDGGKDVLWVVE